MTRFSRAAEFGGEICPGEGNGALYKEEMESIVSIRSLLTTDMTVPRKERRRENMTIYGDSLAYC